MHLDIRHSAAERWLLEHSGIEPRALDTLTAPRVVPQLDQDEGSMLLILKGVDFTPGAVPTDMIALRLWTDGVSVISCQREQVRATNELQEALQNGCGPVDAGALITEFAERMTWHMEDLIHDHFDAAHAIGHRIGARSTEDLVSELAHLRRVTVRMRHFLGLQRRALARLAASRQPWLSDASRALAREIVQQCVTYGEGLEAAREISAITQDEILQRSTEKTERRLFSLTVITAVFLPLTFLTGLLGVNLAGIPDAHDPLAFLILCIILALLIAGQLWYLHRKGWL